jgi:hypothetical protein
VGRWAISVIGQISIGMSVGTAGLARGLNAARGQVGGFAATVGQGMGNATSGISAGALAMGAAFVGVGALAVAGIGKAIAAGSDLKETLSKTGEVFGGSAGVITGEGQAMAEAYGVAKTEFIGAATQFGQMFKGAGKSQAEAAGLGVQLAKLGMDFASFNNTSNEQAFEAIGSALRNEFNPIEKFGIFLTADAVAAEALRAGLVRNKNAMTDAAKKQATLNLIMKQSKDAQGDLARTAGSAGNQMKQTWGRIGNLAADLGTAFLPITESVLGFANTGLATLNTWVTASRDGITAWLESARAGFVDVVAGTILPGLVGIGERFLAIPENVAAAFGPGTTDLLAAFGRDYVAALIADIEAIGVVWRNLPDYVDVAVLMITERVINLGEYLATIPANLSIIADYIGNNWVQLITDAVGAVGAVFQNLGTNLYNLGAALIAFLSDPTQGFQFDWTPLLTGFQATAAELPALIAPELTSLQDEIDAKLGAIGAKEAARAAEREAAAQAAALAPAAGAGPAAIRPDVPAKPDDLAGRAAEVKFAGAAEAGSKEAYSTLARFRAGSSAGGEGIKGVERNTKAQLDQANQQTGLLRQIAARGGIQPFTAPGVE